MTTVSYSGIAAALSVKYRNQVERQINRAAVILQILGKSDDVDGDKVRWNASFGSDVGTARAEGADVVAYNNDDKIPASMEYANIDDAFSITGKAIRGAAAAGNPAQLAALFREQMNDSITRLAKGIAGEAYSGAGSATHIHGLVATAGPLSATGTYAAIDRGTYPLWASNVYSNNGVARALSKPLMRRVVRGIFEASGTKPDLILCGPAIHEAYGSTFQSERRYVQEVSLSGQTIKLDAGYNMLEFDGRPVIEDVDCPDGEMLFLSSDLVKWRQLPDIGAGNPAAEVTEIKGTPAAGTGDGPTQISARVNYLSRSGDKVNFQLISYLQLQARRPNALGRLTDLQFEDAL